MGGEDGESFNVATWRIVALFAVILTIDTAWEYIDYLVTQRIRRRKLKGFVRAWEQLKFEIMALGLISLLLVVFEVRSRVVTVLTRKRSVGADNACPSFVQGLCGQI
jgi:hypothetical protein